MRSATHSQDGPLVQSLKTLLAARREETLNTLRKFEAEQRSFENERPAEAGDMWNQSTSREELFASISTKRSLLRRVEAALRRIEYGTFGLCRGCGEEIKPKRLEVMPWTELCVRCQERYERAGASPPTWSAFHRMQKHK